MVVRHIWTIGLDVHPRYEAECAEYTHWARVVVLENIAVLALLVTH